jgi:hypothetical protein
MTIGGMALVGAMLVPSAKADDWNRKTEVTFSNPVEIPGVHLSGWGVLPAGTYVFKILDSQSGRHIVRIFNEDETTVYATILAILNYRLQATGKTVMTFSERAAGEPHAIRAWFYPGRNWGEEFVYPKAKAIDLAKLASEPVVAQLKQAPIMAIQPTGEEAPLAQVVTGPPAMDLQVAAGSVREKTLPSTASPFPALAIRATANRLHS